MTDPSVLGPIVITSREVYDAVVRLTGRVDVLIAQQQASAVETADHETRLRSLERARWPLPSASLLIALSAFIVGFIR